MEDPKPPENRNINTEGGNYNERIEGDYIQGKNNIQIDGNNNFCYILQTVAPETKINLITLQAAKEDYLKQLKKVFDDVPLAGIDVEENNISQPVSLTKIFVMPDIEKEISDSYRNESVERCQEVHVSKQSEKSRRKILAKDLFKDVQTKRVLLLGTPGSGKTALINYFVITLCKQESDFGSEFTVEQIRVMKLNRRIPQTSCIGLSNETDWLPIVIRIRELARYPDMSILDFARYFAEKDLSCSPLPQEFFEYWLKDGRALIFFDGLDEVGKEQQSKIVERIKAFLEKYAQNRAIITSRPVGNPGRYFQEKEFPRYRIQPFQNYQIARFIDFWYDSHFSNKAEADRRKVDLKTALFGNDRIQLLARNPLLLTIILITHRTQAQLPKERCDLYNYAINTLLEKWDESKELRNYEVLQYLKIDDLRWLMARLAYWIHTQGGLGNEEGGTLIERDTLVEQLHEYIQAEKRIKYHQAKAEAERFLDQIVRDRTGLLSLQGDGYYAFVHRTFQEYLTAEDICNRAKEDGELELLPCEIQSHLHNSYWYEVILLLVAQLTGKKAVQAIRTILQSRSEYEQWLHRDLLFAGRCLGENPKLLEQGKENAKLVTEILTQLVKLETTDDFRVGLKIKKQIPDILLNLSGTSFAAEALQLINCYKLKIDYENFLMYRLTLGEHQEVVNKIFPLLKNQYAFERTIKMLKKVVKYSNISNFLIKELCSQFHGELGIAKALSELGYRDEYVNFTLASYYDDEYHDYIAHQEHDELIMEEANSIYSQIEPLLSRLRSNSESVIDDLIDWLDYEDYGISEYVANELGEVSKFSKLIELKILRKLQEQSPNEYNNIVDALGYLRNPSQDVINTLVSLLHNGENVFLRASAAKALSQLDIDHNFVLSQLLDSLKDFTSLDSLPCNFPDDPCQNALYFISEVFKALVQLGKTFDLVAPALDRWIEQHQDKENVGVFGIDALWMLVEDTSASPKQRIRNLS